MIIAFIILFSTVALLLVAFDLKQQIEMLREYREDCDLILFQIKDVLLTAGQGEADQP